MRVVTFFVYLCFHLLSGGSHLHADTPHKGIAYSLAADFELNKQVKFTNDDRTSIIIDDADFDFDEEYSNSDNTKEGSSNKVFAGKYCLLSNRYLTNSPLYVLNRYQKVFKISQTFCGNSSPIYIKNRVLRI